MSTTVTVRHIALALLCTIAAASAGPHSEDLKAQAKVSEADAQKTALARVPGGTIKSSELEQEYGRLIWSFDITTAKASKVTEVNVDARSGAIVAVHKETPAKEAREAAAEAKETAGKATTTTSK